MIFMFFFPFYSHFCLLYFHRYKPFFFSFLCFPTYYNVNPKHYQSYYTLNITTARKKMSVNDIRVFIYENYSKRIGFSKEDSYCPLKRMKKRFIVVCQQINRKSTSSS